MDALTAEAFMVSGHSSRSGKLAASEWVAVVGSIAVLTLWLVKSFT
jgi:hypothetical protein